MARGLALVFMLAAAFVAWREFEPLMFFRRVDGVVMSAGVQKIVTYGRRGHTHHAPQIFYRYQVNGRQ